MTMREGDNLGKPRKWEFPKHGGMILGLSSEAGIEPPTSCSKPSHPSEKLDLDDVR